MSMQQNRHSSVITWIRIWGLQLKYDYRMLHMEYFKLSQISSPKKYMLGICEAKFCVAGAISTEVKPVIQPRWMYLVIYS